MGIVADGYRVALGHHLHLLTVDIFTVLAEAFCPSVIDQCLVKDAEILLGCQRVATDDVAFCQTAHHTHIAVVMGEDVGHHGSSLSEGHIAQYPVKLVHVADGEHRRLRTNLVECAQICGRELQQAFWQQATLGLNQIVEEQHL